MRISINGKFVERIVLQGTEPEFHYGYGVFETLRTYQGKLFTVTEHLNRLRRSANIIHLSINPPNKTLRRWLEAHCRSTGETRIKLMAAPKHIYILSTQLRIPKKVYTHGVSVTTYQTTRQQTSVKGNAWVQEHLAYQHAVQHGYYDSLLLNHRQQVPEAACGNLFFIKKNILYSANHQILFGVTRGIVLKLARGIVPVRFKMPTLKNIREADECFMTRSGAGIVPITRVTNKIIGAGKPGSVTKQLMNKFTDYAMPAKATKL